jgi:hypothetical protein
MTTTASTLARRLAGLALGVTAVAIALAPLAEAAARIIL